MSKAGNVFGLLSKMFCDTVLLCVVFEVLIVFHAFPVAAPDEAFGFEELEGEVVVVNLVRNVVPLVAIEGVGGAFDGLNLLTTLSGEYIGVVGGVDIYGKA